jgi:hypothetical protein
MLSAAYLEPTVLMEVRSETWEEILALSGDAHRLLDGKFDIAHFLESLSATPAVDRLDEALQVVHELGTDEGRDLILQATTDQNIDSNERSR